MLPRFRSSWVPLAAILAVAAMVRCDGLGQASYDFDQAFCWKMTTFPVGEVAARCAADNHPPLYFYLLWFWARAFGDSLLALRSLSVVFGLATVAGAYLLVRQIQCKMQNAKCKMQNDASGNKLDSEGLSPSAPDQRPTAFQANRKSKIENPKSARPHPGPLPEVPEREGELAALAAAALVALSHLQIFWARQVRMYAAGAFLAVASSYLLLRAVQAPRPRWRDYAWYTLAATALAYTHYFGLFIVAGQFLYAVGAALSPSKSEWDGLGRPSSRVRFLVCAFALVGLLWSPWLPVFLGQRAQVSESFWSGALGWEDWLRVGADLSEFARRGSRDSPAAWAATLAIAVLPVAMVCWGRGGLRLIGLCLLVTFDGAFCASVADRNIISPHYFVFAQALLLCGLPALVNQMSRDHTNPTRERGTAAGSPHWRFGFALRTGALAALVGGAAWLCSQHAGRQASIAARPGMMAAMAYLADVRQNGEPLVVSNPMVQIAAAGHAARDAAPRVLSTSAWFPYFQGTAVMRSDEYLSRSQFEAMAPRRVWAIDAVNCFAGTWKVELPDEWIDVAEEVFPGPPSPRSQIIVRCYERRRQAKR